MNPILESPKQESDDFIPLQQDDNGDIIFCFKESNTIVCGKITYFNYEDIDKKSTFEPFFGEIDLFGF